MIANNSVGWYLLARNKLVAYQHVDFETRCDGRIRVMARRDIPKPYVECLIAFAPEAILRKFDSRTHGCGRVPLIEVDI